ncbi:MAG: hypothetical protein A2168_05355 [Planctomycetes bacterium RBG_13_50_24]|nr:MAG: hypothetical protein A2168_05355 [Planctomycetes bacterium RBG_13_50_24]
MYEPVAEVVLPTGDANVPRAVEEKDGYVYLLAREGILYTYDISDLPLQQSFTTYNTPVYKQTSYNGSGLLRDGNYLYVFGGNGIQTIDVQNPGMPELLGLTNDLNIYNMVRHENYLIAAGQQRIAVYSIDEPSNPTLLSDLNIFVEQLVWSAAVYGSTLYACHWTSDWQGSYMNALSIIDFSNPAGLSVLNTISRDDQAYHLRVIDNQLVECTSNQVGLWDLTTPANPVLLTSKAAGGRICALDGDNIVTNGTVLRPNGNDLQIVATFAPGGSQRDGYPYGSAANDSFVFIAQHKRILILNASMPPLSINHASGGPGSFFTITGHGFPPNRTATFIVNSYTLGNVATDAAGDCIFLLGTEQSDEGRYVVSATVDRSASTSFVIASGEPVHPQEGSGTIFQIPSGIAYATYSGGTGEPNDPYQIATAADLIALGETPEDYDKHFILTADIELDPNLPGRKVFDGAVIAPDTDPNTEWDFKGTPFTGVLDGNRHTISRLTIAGGAFVGLFGQLVGGEVKDVGIADVEIAGSGSYVGGLAGEAHGGAVTRCYSTGVVRGNGLSVGGLTGCNRGTVTQCYSTGMVTGAGGSFAGAGGLVGTNYDTVTQCYSTGAVHGYSGVGGLVGLIMGGSVTQCYSTGAANGFSAHVGGLVGWDRTNSSKITTSFWDTQTSGTLYGVGGIEPDPNGVIGKTTAEMQTASTFLNTGWDFVGETANGTEDIWWILEGQDYPRLWWEAE